MLKRDLWDPCSRPGPYRITFSTVRHDRSCSRAVLAYLEFRLCSGRHENWTPPTQQGIYTWTKAGTLPQRKISPSTKVVSAISLPMASFSVSTIQSARDIPAAVWDVFRENAQASNVMYAHADNAFKSPTPDGTADCWVVVWNLTEPSGTSAAILFVLSCTTGPLGPYPIFIFTPLPAASLAREFLSPRILAMARALRLMVAPERVFSVFAVDALADAFVASWTVETGIQLNSNPVYYHASLMCCDRNTLRTHPPQGEVTFASRLATAADVKKVSLLCQDFSATSVSGHTLDRWLMF